jgi:hypothetical protein
LAIGFYLLLVLFFGLDFFCYLLCFGFAFSLVWVMLWSYWFSIC